MTTLRISLFGKLQLEYCDHPLPDIEGQKVRELFCYLLVYQERPHPREILANLMWNDKPTETSKKYLRHTLWQLQSYFKSAYESFHGHGAVASAPGILQVEPEWISLNGNVDLWMDISEFERTYATLQPIPGESLDDRQLARLIESTDLYCGELLEGCFHDWCIYERERFQLMYLTMLDKLIDFHSTHRSYNEAIMRGLSVLRYEPARERTHRKLMQLYYLAGDRSAALRQYHTCAAVLEEELGVEPALSTTRLYQHIRQGSVEAHQIFPMTEVEEESQSVSHFSMDNPPHAVEQLHQVQATLLQLTHQIERCIQAFDRLPRSNI